MIKLVNTRINFIATEPKKKVPRMKISKVFTDVATSTAGMG
jgi:hypothetical protein